MVTNNVYTWNIIEKSLVKISSNRLKDDLPEIEFIISCMVCAAEERIVDYFDKGTFSMHCKLLRLDKSYVYKLFEKMWELDKRCD